MQPINRREQEPQSPPPPSVEFHSPDQSISAVAGGLRALSQSSASSADDPWRLEAELQDHRAIRYDEIHELMLPIYRSYEDWMTEAIYSAWYEVRGRLLLVGCCTGGQLQRLAQRMPAKLLTAIDLAPEMTRRTREKVPSSIEVRTLPFDRFMPSVPFDVVAFTGSLAAMPDLKAACEHAARMTVLGSRLVICAANGDWEYQEAARSSRARLLYPGWFWHRLKNHSRLQRVAELRAESPTSPHPPLTAGRIAAGFEARFGVRDQKTDFGVSRLFQDVVAIDPAQALRTIGPTRETRPYHRTVERLRKLDAALQRRHPEGGGVLAMLLDRLR